MAIKRRLKSVTAPRRKKPLLVSAKKRQQRIKAKHNYTKNRTKILKAAQIRRKHLTLAEKEFNRKRAAFLKKNKPLFSKVKSAIKKLIKRVRHV